MSDRDNQSNKIAVGVSMVSVLSNIAYAGMKAQGSKDGLGRFLSFWLGFPGTLVSYFVVEEGSERAYGVDLPRRSLVRSKNDLN
jgi:hypothetical protein